MKTKIYIANINETINNMFNNATLLYPQAQIDETKPNCLTTFINEGSKFIAIGTGNEYADERPTFSNWEEAADYAKTLTAGEYIIGIRKAGHIQAIPVAKFNA